MSVPREESLNISPYWRWLLLALLLHAVLLLGLKTAFVQPTEFDVSSDENTPNVSLNTSAETTIEQAPSQAETPTPASLAMTQPVTPNPDDVVVPKGSATPAPPPLPATRIPPENLHSKLPTPPQPPHSDIKHTTEHHKSLPGRRQGSAENGKASYLANPEPPYPESAREAQIEGRVDLMVSINETGTVTEVRLVRTSGDPSLDQSALYTVRTRWKFRPARAAGSPVSSQVLLPITFRLSE